MTLEDKKNLISDQAFVIAESIHELENKPSRVQVDKAIWQLYQVMRQLSDWSEESGYDR